MKNSILPMMQKVRRPKLFESLRSHSGRKWLTLFFAFIAMNATTVKSNGQACPDYAAAQKRVASSFHSTIMIDHTGAVKYWGQNGDPNTAPADALTPGTLAGFDGTPVAVAAGSRGSGGNNHQLYLLTTTKLYGWGHSGKTIVSGTDAPVVLTDMTGDLPSGVGGVGNISFIEASGGGLALVTTISGGVGGEVWVKNGTSSGGAVSEIYGDGTSGIDQTWHRVERAGTNNPLTGVRKLSFSQRGLMALTNTNQIYVWGSQVMQGITGNAPADFSKATLVTLPALPTGAFPSDMKIISKGYDGSATHATMFIMSGGTEAKLYGIGEGFHGALGQNNESDQTEWVKVKAPGGTGDLSDIVQIGTNSAYVYEAAYYSVGALTSDGTLYLWGDNNYSMLGYLGTTGNVPLGAIVNFNLPRRPNNFSVNDAKVGFFHMGGHTTIAFLQGSNRFCYVGHKIAGSMGDGVEDQSNPSRRAYDCINTPDEHLCTPPPAVGCAPPSSNDLLASSVNGTLVVNGEPSVTFWGQAASSAEAGVDMPLPKTLYEYAGVPKGVAAGGIGTGTSAQRTQMWLLTTEGLWGWGYSANTVDNITPSAVGFTKLALPVAVGNVSFIRSARGGVAVVTNTGEVYVKAGEASSCTANVYGDGTGTLNDQWHQVLINGGSTPLTGVKELSFAGSAAMAVTAGGVYVWGNKTYLGGNGAATDRNKATLIPPANMHSDFAGTVIPKAVEIIQYGTTGAAQFILATNGKVYSLGSNQNGILGQGLAIGGENLNWAPCINLASVRKLSSNNPYANSFYSIGALTLNGSLYTWGSNTDGIIGAGGTGNVIQPTLPVGLSAGEISAFEMGGAQTIAFRKVQGPLLFTGNVAGGAKGDNTGTTVLNVFTAGPNIVNCAGNVYSITGHVYNDADSMTDGLVDGSGVDLISGIQLYANLLDENGYVVDTFRVTGGQYSFAGYPSGNYSVQVSNVKGTLFSPAPTTALPGAWQFTGAQLGTTPNVGVEPGTPNGFLKIALNSNVTNANIGVNNNVSISGNVWNDNNSDAVKLSPEVATNAGGQLNAYLVNNVTNVVLAASAVIPAGTYFFSAPSDNTYKIIISSAVIVPNGTNTLTTSVLPTDSSWINTGVNINNTPNTVNTTGIITVAVTGNTTNLNFGIRKNMADLSLLKTVNNQSPYVGDTVRFAIVLTNGGPGSATNVVVSDVLPAGLTLVRDSATNGAYASNGLWTLTNPLKKDSTATLVVWTKVNPSGPYLNYAQVNSSDQKDPNSTPGNNSTNEDDDDAVTLTPVAVANLSLVKTVNNATPNVGTNVVFTLTLSNAGPSTATGIQVKDLLPNGYAVVSASTTNGSYSNITGIWNLTDPLLSGNNIALDITATVNATGNYNNYAEVFVVNEHDPNSTPGNNSTTEDDDDTESTTPVPVTDLSVVKSGPARVNENGTVSYTLLISNAGPSNAVDIRVQDAAVSNFTASGFTCSSALGTCPVSNNLSDLQSGTLTIPSLPKDATLTLTVTGTAGNSAQFINNLVTLTPQTGTVDPVPGNNTDTAGTQINAAIAGTVFNDVDGMNGVPANTINGPGTNISNTLYAHLVNNSNTVVATVAVQNDGTYRFPAVIPGTYSVVLNTSSTASSTPGLPAAWVNTAEFWGNSAGNDGLANGTLSAISVADENVRFVNFGIEQPPVATNDTATAQTNPGGNVSVTVPGNIFDITDAAPGAVTAIVISSIPANANSITIGNTVYSAANPLPQGGVRVPANLTTGQPLTPIQVDPVSGAVIVSISYVALDSAGKQSAPAVAALPFTTINIGGTVFNDVNGMNGILFPNRVDGIGTNPGGLYAVLVNAGNNTVAASQLVGSNGTYNFTELDGGNYNIVLSTTPPANGTNATNLAASLPVGWVHTGEHHGTGQGNDGNTNGILPLGQIMNNTSVANFGIEQPPAATAATMAPRTNPGGNLYAPVAASTFVTADPAPGAVWSIRITDFPANANNILIGGTTYNAGNWPSGGVTIPVLNGTPALSVEVDPIDGATTVQIPYIAVDQAGKTSSTVIASVPFQTITINGTVFNDVNGLNGTPANTIDGAGISFSGLNAVLTDANTDTVVAIVPVSATNGAYSFPGLDGGSYNVRITTQTATIGSAQPAVTLPAGWVHTGEHNGAGPGTDGSANGILAIGAVNENLGNINFGIEQPPVAHNATAPGQPNPGGNINVTVPPATFNTEDAAPGGVTHIVITALPANANSITINGITYNATNPMPAGGVSVPVNTNGQPIQPILIDPVNGPVTVGIIYYAVDGAGKQSEPATASVPFSTFAISGNVYHDNNGLTGSPANTVDGTGTNAGGLKAVLVNTANNTVAAVATVAANGSFSFPDASAGNYSILITTANVSGNQVPAVVLPAGWVTTGEYYGAGAGNDGNANGILPLGAVSGETSNVKFGMQQLPEAYDVPLNFQLNPGGTATVPVSTMGGNDPEDGTKGTGSSFVIVTLPGQGTLYYNGIPVNAGDTIHNYAPALLQVDPIDSVANIVFQYTVLDNAGFADPTPATVNMSFIPIPLKGNVLNDANGMSDNTVNGIGLGIASGAPLYVNLVDTATNTVFASVPVNANGSYYFSTVRPDANLSVQVNMVPGVAGQPAPAVQLPNGWLPTGEHTGTGTGHDGTPDGKQMVYTGLDYNGVSNVKFGIERTPVADVKTISIPSAGLNVPYPLTTVPLSGSDPEDGTYGAGSSNFVFGQQPACCAVISYNGTPLVPGATIPNYNPALLTVTFTDIMAQQVIFTYKVVDAAGKQSPEVNYIINTGTVLPVKWSVFTAKAEQGSSRLDWTTLTESNNEGFGIERSADSRSWQEISFVSSLAENGNSKEALNYTAYDRAPLSGTNYYRLRQTDRDGQYTYSEVREVVFGANGNAISIYPNPATDKVFVKAADWSKIKKVKMLDATGRQVYQALAADATDGILMDNRAQGTYLIQVVHNNGEVSSFKLVKK